MTVSNHYIEEDLNTRIQCQAMIHRKCLLLLLAQSACTAVQPARPAQQAS